MFYIIFQIDSRIFHRAKAFQLNKQNPGEAPPIIENKSFQNFN